MIKPTFKSNGWHSMIIPLRLICWFAYSLPLVTFIQFYNINLKAKGMYDKFEPTTLMYWTICDCIFFIFWILCSMGYMALAYIFKVRNIFAGTKRKDN
jgi:hypothetical protein